MNSRAGSARILRRYGSEPTPAGPVSARRVGGVTLPTHAWSELQLVERIAEGNRNEVWRGRLRGEPVSVRRSRRDGASLAWELDLIAMLGDAGFVVPTVLPTDDGARHDGGVVVQRWLSGRAPESDTDWSAVASELQRLHGTMAGAIGQRPGCCAVPELPERRRSVDADLDAVPDDERAVIEGVLAGFDDVPTAVIHGDTNPSNFRIDDDGQVGLLDWDESRVDIVWHDLSNLGVQVLSDADHARALRLSNAWEAVNAWVVEPEYARSRLALLR